MYGIEKQGSLEVKVWGLYFLGYNMGFNISYEI